MKIGKLEITANRWPWQKGYNWKGMEYSSAPLNYGGAKFGGAGRYRIGIDVGGTKVVLNLLFGMIRIAPVKE